MFSGAFTALVTPFRNGEVDVEALEGMVEFQIQGGVHGLVLAVLLHAPVGAYEPRAQLAHLALGVRVVELGGVGVGSALAREDADGVGGDGRGAAVRGDGQR